MHDLGLVSFCTELVTEPENTFHARNEQVIGMRWLKTKTNQAIMSNIYAASRSSIYFRCNITFVIATCVTKLQLYADVLCSCTPIYMYFASVLRFVLQLYLGVFAAVLSCYPP